MLEETSRISCGNRQDRYLQDRDPHAVPSSVYWQGLARWGIRLFPGSQTQYHRSLDGYDRLLV